MMRGRFKLIAFSGIDGAGKSTQIELIIERLKSEGYSPKYIWSRGGYVGPTNTLKKNVQKLFGGKVIPTGRKSSARKKAFSNKLIRNIWIYLAIIDLIVVYGMYIPFLTLIGRTVIADRYLIDTKIDFTLNFQGADVDNWLIWKLLIRLAPTPDIHFLLLIPVEESLIRSKLKNEPFPDSQEVLQARLKYYTEYANFHEVNVVDCTESIEHINNIILEQMDIEPQQIG